MRLRRPAETPGLLQVLRIEDSLLLAAVLCLPWAFGGVVVWGYRTAALLLVGAAAVCVVRDGPAGLGLDRRARWLLPALLLGVWAGLQLLPLPPGVVKTLSPTADALYRDTFPGYGGPAAPDLVAALEERALAAVPEVDGVPEPPSVGTLPFVPELGGRWTGWRTLSLSPHLGLESLFWFLALLAGFLVARRRCSDPDVAHAYSGCLAMLFAVLALFGLVYAATANDKLYWVFLSAPNLTPSGPYVNPNHFAGVMELGTPWLLGWAGLRLRRRDPDTLNPPTPLLVTGAVLCILAGGITGSRSYPLVLAISVAWLLLAAMRTNRQRWVALVGGALLVAGALLVLDRISTSQRPPSAGDAHPTNIRVQSWSTGLTVFADYPLTGSGFGSLGDVVSHYRPAGGRTRMTELHNDYLEVLVEGGVIAGVLLLWLLAGWSRRVFRKGTLWVDGEVDLQAAGLLAGLVALSIHALWSFNPQIPANGLLFVTMAAVAVARGEGSMHEAGGTEP